MPEYDKYVEIIEELEKKTPDYKSRIERNLLEEELLFSYKFTTFENWEKAITKLNKLSYFWKRAKEFYEEKKRLVNNFSEDLNIYKYLDFFESLRIESSFKTQKNDDPFYKITKFVDDDITNFKDFLTASLSIFEDTEKTKFVENSKKTEEIKNRNIDPAIKLLLQKVYNDAYIQFL